MKEKITRIYQVVAYPIKGVSDRRLAEIIKKSRIDTEFGEGQYGRAKEAARDISELGGVRRTDILCTTTRVRQSLIGAYSVGAYISEGREDPATDFHYKSGNHPPETRRAKKQAKLARKAAGLP